MVEIRPPLLHIKIACFPRFSKKSVVDFAAKERIYIDIPDKKTVYCN